MYMFAVPVFVYGLPAWPSFMRAAAGCRHAELYELCEVGTVHDYVQTLLV